MRTNRFQGLTTPLQTSSLHRIRTAFSPSSPRSKARALSPSSVAYSSTSSDTTSPLSEPRSRNLSSEGLDLSSPSSGSSYCGEAPLSASSTASRLRAALTLRAMKRRPSLAVMEMEEERKSFPHGLGIMEPRPATQYVLGGISEVLEGRV